MGKAQQLDCTGDNLAQSEYLGVKISFLSLIMPFEIQLVANTEDFVPMKAFNRGSFMVETEKHLNNPMTLHT